MEMIPVSSSNLSSVGYDEDLMILRVEFNNGRVYEYYGVSPEIFEGLINAPSHGSFLSENIIKGGFRYERLH